MEYRRLGNSGLKISPLCLGTMMFGGPTNEDDSLAILQRAVDAGINFIDTADIYGAGRSESLIGEVLAQRQRSHPDERIVVATKMGRGPGWNDSPAAIREAALRSCERLGVAPDAYRRRFRVA